MSSRGIFILAITWIVMSPFWFWAENIALGIIWLCGGVIELFIALVRRIHNYLPRQIPIELNRCAMAFEGCGAVFSLT